MPEPINVRPILKGIPAAAAACHKGGTPRRCRINHKYKYRRASCPLAFEEPLPGKLYRSKSEIMEDGGSVSSTSGSAGGGGGHGSSSASSSAGEELIIRIHVPELRVDKCLQFHKDDLVWEVKQQALSNLPKELRECFNYGLFCPPQNGRAGKFLDEERPLSDYPFSTPVGYLELKYKRRVYKMLNLEEKSLRALHTRANMRRFLEFVKDNNVEKVAKMCGKGLDPNFHCQESGETPLTMASRLKKSSRMIMNLVNGGALLDYRTREGLTPMHRAVQAGNFEALKTLLDLGASPNYRDLRGLTPLYYTVTHATDPMLCEALLHDYAPLGASDNQGWQETHQACRNKLVQHLEHLLFYGADMNAQNASGNTPLHVCAVNNLEDCARVLLFRGCDKNALNFANQTPYQVAVIAGNMDLAQVIQTHTLNDIVSFKEPPRYNQKRRISGAPLSRAHSDPRLEVCVPNKPPSPSPSNRSIPPFSSASSLSETSTGSGSTCTHPSEMDSEECASALGSASLNAANENSDIVSDSSGVCTSNSGSNDSYDSTVGLNSSSSTILKNDAPSFNVGMLVVCLKQYTPRTQGHLDINPGDIIEVTGSTDDGLLEGCLKGKVGTFPPTCVQEVRLRNPKNFRENVIGHRMVRAHSRDGSMEVSSAGAPSHYQQGQIYGTIPRNRVGPEPRTVILHRGKKGFGFVLRGAKATSPLIERPYERGPALQYLDDVDPAGVADCAGLKKGDYLLRINDEDVSQASHEHVVNIIKKSGDLVKMAVMSPTPVTFMPSKGSQHGTQSPSHGGILSGTLRRGCQTLPRKFNVGRGIQPPPAPPPRDPNTTLSVGRARAKSMVAGLQDIESFGGGISGVGEPTMMSRSAYQVSSLSSQSDSSNAGGSPCGTPGMKIASIKARPSSKRVQVAWQQNEASTHLGNSLPCSPPTSPSGKAPRVYASVAEMKKARALKARMASDQAMRLHKDFFSTPDLQAESIIPPLHTDLSQEEKRRSLSQEDLFMSVTNVQKQRHSASFARQRVTFLDWKESVQHEYDEDYGESSFSGDPNHPRLKRSQSAVNPNQLKISSIHPPPSHPPPPVPVGKFVKVDLIRSKSDYAAVGKSIESNYTPLSSPDNPPLSPTSGVMSSFRPCDSAKLYASPEEIKAFGVKNVENGTLKKNGSAKSRSQSLPPTTNRPPVQKTSSEKETSGDSGVYSATYSTFRNNTPDSQLPNGSKSSTDGVTESQQENVTYARPKKPHSINCNTGNSPVIPDPDYSSEDESAYNSQDGSQPKKTKNLKKKKQTVMFASSVSYASPHESNDNSHYAVSSSKNGLNSVSNNSNFADLIAQKAAERKARQDSGSGSAPASANSSPIKRKNGSSNDRDTTCLNDAIKGSNLFNKQKQKSTEASTNVTSTITKMATKYKSGQRQTTTESNQLRMKNSRSCPNEFSIEDGDNSSSGVSSDQEPMQQEPSYVTVINTESEAIIEQKSQRLARTNSRDDSSEASESSDEASDRTWILTNEKGDKSDSGKDSDSSNSSRRSGTLTRNAVSLVKLPPPQETTEHDIENDAYHYATRMMSRSMDQDAMSSLSSRSSLSSGSGSTGGSRGMLSNSPSSSSNSSTQGTVVYYPPTRTQYSVRGGSAPPVGHQAQVAASSGAAKNRYASRDMYSRSAEAESITGMREKVSYPASRSATLDRNFFNSSRSAHSSQSAEQLHPKYERSIEESLQLIRMHMQSLNEVNSLAGIGSGKQGGTSGEMVLAPPPEFCDMRHHGAPHGAGENRARTVIHISREDFEPDLPVQIIKKSSLQHGDGRSFRNKLLCEWTTKDTTDWLDSLYMPEYIDSFFKQQIDGHKLMHLNNDALINLGIRKIGHRVKIEKSLKRYRPMERIDL